MKVGFIPPILQRFPATGTTRVQKISVSKFFFYHGSVLPFEKLKVDLRKISTSLSSSNMLSICVFQTEAWVSQQGAAAAE